MMLGGIGGWFGYPELTMELILGYLFSPVAYIIGIPWSEAIECGKSFGTETCTQ